MPIEREKLDAMKKHILTSLISSRRSINELTRLPLFKSVMGVHIAVEELEFERMIVKDDKGRFYVPEN